MDVVVIGGGVAGLETAAALRALAGSRAHVKVVDPAEEFVVRALSVAEPFGAGEARRYPLPRIAADLGFELIHDRVESVAAESRRAVLASGRELAYDALLVALGARQQPAWDHTLTFGGPRSVATMRALVDEVRGGRTRSVAFLVPSGVTWPLPLYELALMTAAAATDAGVEADLALFTPEYRPLEVLGRQASDEVRAELEAAGVRLSCGEPVEVSYDGDVLIAAQELSLGFDRVVAVPRLAGPAPHGLPCDVYGFLPIDAFGMVRGADGVYAAGDCTDYPVKQGRIAAQQADSVAECIARAAGAGTEPHPFPQAVRAQLFTRGGPGAKLAGAHLAPYLESLDATPLGVA